MDWRDDKHGRMNLLAFYLAHPVSEAILEARRTYLRHILGIALI
jgi:hypothetical protein